MNHSVDYYAEDAKLRAFGLERGLELGCGYDGWAMPVTLSRESSIEEVQEGVLEARSAWRSTRAPLGEASIEPHTGGLDGASYAGEGIDASVPSFRYDSMPGLFMWEPGQSPSPQWKR